MSDDYLDKIKNPKIRSLCELLLTMPEYLEEKRRKAEERKAFVTKVWEQAIRDAGLINKKLT